MAATRIRCVKNAKFVGRVNKQRQNAVRKRTQSVCLAKRVRMESRLRVSAEKDIRLVVHGVLVAEQESGSQLDVERQAKQCAQDVLLAEKENGCLVSAEEKETLWTHSAHCVEVALTTNS